MDSTVIFLFYTEIANIFEDVLLEEQCGSPCQAVSALGILALRVKELSRVVKVAFYRILITAMVLLQCLIRLVLTIRKTFPIAIMRFFSCPFGTIFCI